MRFVLEEASWAWNGTGREAYIERIEQLLDRLDAAHARREPFAASDELLSQPILGTSTLADLLWDRSLALSLPHDVSERLTPHFDKMRRWDEEMEWPPFEVDIAGTDVLSPSAALAHARVVEGQATACLPLPGTWSGPLEVTVGGVEARVHFVVNEASHRAFFRDALRVERVDEAGLETLAPHAFPALFFLDGVWDGLRHFQGGYARVRDTLHHLLGVLDDHGAWVFTDDTGRLSPTEPEPKEDAKRTPVTNQIIERRFKGWGLDIAPENPNVRVDGKCRRARERALGKKTLYCEWHYKFEPDTNRAHLHGPVPESGKRMIIAIFRDHLPLPGDE
jgi:hypothetical protein